MFIMHRSIIVLLKHGNITENNNLKTNKMESKITKGDWSVQTIDLIDFKSMCIISEYEQKVIAHIYLTPPKITEENTENANLISAAPDLLKALNNLMSGVENLPALSSISGVLEQQYKQAQLAVKKAYGHHF